ncbi:hypothetical protein BKH08_03445 [Actinomyces naeslundii]|nr:hypothetical protein BKH11_11800 [Actinomyces naeslundii]OMG13419.1 hypothetical protein BKH08_03445 [Actinomyces naeslundii]
MSSLVSSGSDHTPPKDETVPGPDNGLLALWPTRSSRPSLTRRRRNLQPQIKSTFKMGSLIGRGSGESFQLAFHGPGFVVVQPSEGQPMVAVLLN